MARGKKNEKELTIEERLKQALVPVEKQPYSVPENWCWVKVGALSTLHRGVSYKKHDVHFVKQENDCLILRGGNINEGSIDVDQSDNVYVDMALVDKEQLIQEYDVVIVSSTGSTKIIGRAGISHESFPDVAFGAFLTLIRPTSDTLKPFIAYYFQTDLYRERIRNLAAGVNINNIRADYITESPVPFPPLAEQQRLVDRIENLFAKLDEAKEKAQAVVDGFETRKAAILHKAFTGELTKNWCIEHGVDRKRWITKNLGDITINHDSQRIPLSREERSGLAHLFDYYGASGVIDRVDRYIFEGRFLLIGEDGANLVMRSKPIAFIAEGQFWVNNHAHVLDTVDDISMDFLCYYINSIDLTSYITGSAQPKMTQAKMNSIPVPVPTIDEQIEIVRILDTLFEKEQQAKETAEAVVDQIEAIKKSILARAFRGELGTNDPAEESAEKLLNQTLKERQIYEFKLAQSSNNH